MEKTIFMKSINGLVHSTSDSIETNHRIEDQKESNDGRKKSSKQSKNALQNSN